MIDAIAVLDIGKTNKKVLIYDKQLKILDKNTKAFGEVAGDNGLKLEHPKLFSIGSFLYQNVFQQI